MRVAFPRSGAVGLTLVLLSLFAAACGEESQSPTGIDALYAIGDRIGIVEMAPPGIGSVCAFYPDDDHDASTFSASATGGDVIGGTFEIGPFPGPHCIEVWNATTADAVQFTASLVDNPETLELDRIATLVGEGPAVTFLYDVSTATVDVSDLVGASIWFKFKRVDTPPEGGFGCTPGYWRQRHHYDSWVGYSPSDLFSSVFDDAFPGMTLGEVVQIRGGHLNALGRHAVAALLNASSPDVEYDLTVQEVIDGFNQAFNSGDAAQIEDNKNVFDFLNNQGCTLN